jgi:ABC-type amino acid transport system permease subunit
VSELRDKFILDFIEKNRWQYIVSGLKTTLLVTALALVLGLIIGIVVAVIRTAHDQIDEKKLHGPFGLVLRLLNLIAKIYLTIIRGTPTMVQLLIIYFIIMANSTNKILTVVLAFGINSGAYVAEIFRSGIMSIDKGQMEAGRSLGLDYKTTMIKIILPQALKNVLPALVNEMITLLKETSISGYIGLNELTRGSQIITGVTYDAMLPLLAVAAIYLAIVMFFTWIMGKLERRLRESDYR